MQNASLTVPEPVRSAQAPKVNIMTTKLADGVWLIGGGSHNSVAVEFKDFAAIIETPLDDARSNAVIAPTTITNVYNTVNVTNVTNTTNVVRRAAARRLRPSVESESHPAVCALTSVYTVSSSFRVPPGCADTTSRLRSM